MLVPSVFEHVADPYRVADECHRVLKSDGYIYAVTPFMQPVHLGVYDFTRFTFVGYRRLFRRFREVKLTAALGPGSSLAYSIQYFLTSFTENHNIFRILNLIGLLITRPIKYFDKILDGKRSALGCAAGYLFFGKKSEKTLSDRDLVESFRSRIR